MMDWLPTQWPALIGIGVLGGIIGSALGVGGGILIVPSLVLFLEFDQKVAQGTSLAVMAPMAVMATLRYQWNKDIPLDWTVILLLVPFMLIGANIGSTVAAYLPASVLKKIFGAFVIIVGLRLLIKG